MQPESACLECNLPLCDTSKLRSRECRTLATLPTRGSCRFAGLHSGLSFRRTVDCRERKNTFPLAESRSNQCEARFVGLCVAKREAVTVQTFGQKVLRPARLAGGQSATWQLLQSELAIRSIQ